MKTALLERVKSKISETYNKAEGFYGISFSRPKVNYLLRGAIAGKAYFAGNIISLNYKLLEENGEDFINRTVPHEIAHLVAKRVYNSRGHDKYWKAVMRALGLNPVRCHSYSIKNVSNVIMYKCACTEHEIGIRKHNNMMRRGGRLRCRTCKTFLKTV